MPVTSRLYVKGIHERFAYLAAWLPNSRLRLGDVGIRENDGFKQMTSLSALGIPFQVRRGANELTFNATSRSGVTVKSSASAGVQIGVGTPLSDGNISVEFDRQGAFLFHAIGCREDTIEDKVSLGQTVLAMIRRGTWDREWVVIDTLVGADSATIVVSNSEKSSLQFAAKGPIDLSNLANADAGLTVSSQRGDVISLVATEGLTPLFKVGRANRSIVDAFLQRPIRFGGPAVPSGSNADPPPLEDVGPE